VETRLFFIGLAMGAVAWTGKQWSKSGVVNTPVKSGLWHGFFCALSAFSIALVLVLSFESRMRFISVAAHVLSTAELYPSLALAAIAGAIGFWRGYSKGKKPSDRLYFVNEDTEWAETVFSAVLLASVLMYFVVQAFKIPSGSMEKTLLIGDHLFVNKFIYGARVPISGKRVLPLKKVSRGDVIVFRFPSDDPTELHCGSIQYGKDFIKRVVGVPGDQVAVSGGRLFVNGKEVEESYTQYVDGPHRQPASVRSTSLPRDKYQELWSKHELDKELEDIQKDYFGPVKVPDEAYFVMGDNRDRSCDSRYWGPVEAKYLKGKAWFIYWPPSRMRTVN
jgi:signal peptidase I